MKTFIWFAVAALMLIDALGYSFGAIRPIRQALNPADAYWRKRLLLNLMLANQGMYLAAAVPWLGAIAETHQRGSGHMLFWLTLVSCVYTMITVPIFTRRDSVHVIPRAFAAVLIIVGFLSY
jgi:hypothetical protein